MTFVAEMFQESLYDWVVTASKFIFSQLSIAMPWPVPTGHSTTDFLRPPDNAPSSNPLFLLLTEEMTAALIFWHYLRVQLDHLIPHRGSQQPTHAARHPLFYRIWPHAVVLEIQNTSPFSSIFPFTCWLHCLYTVLIYDLCYQGLGGVWPACVECCSWWKVWLSHFLSLVLT